MRQAEAGTKGKKFYSGADNLGEWQTSVSKPISSSCHGKSPTVLSKAKTKASIQSSCSILKYGPLEQSPSPSRCLRLFPAAVHFRFSPGACVAVGHAAARASRSRAPRRESMPMHWRVHHLSKRGSLLEAMVHVVHEESIQVHLFSRSRATVLLYCPRIILAWGWDGQGVLSK